MTPADTVRGRLLADPCPFGLGEALDLLARLTGRADPVAAGVVRVRAARTFAAGGAEVERVVSAADGTWDVYTRAFNLAGAGGVLPDALDRAVFDPGGPPAGVWDLLDEWTHRAAGVWYRAWSAHPAGTAARERPAAVDALFRGPRTFANLARLVGWYVAAPAAVQPGLGRPGDRLTGRCRLIVGPVDGPTARKLRSDAAEFRGLLQLCDAFCDGMVGFELAVVVRGGDLPEARWDDPAARWDETVLPPADPDERVVVAVGPDRCDGVLGRG